jgi:hypothetical protein
MANPRLKLSGMRFGRLTVDGPAGLNHRGNSMWKCVCDCGNKTICKGQHLKTGATNSCGCIRVERVWKHGMSKTPHQATWKNMMWRCYNPVSKDYRNYGERGIRVCENLSASPRGLYDLLGDRPNGMTIERINNNGHYSCGTCQDCIRRSWPKNLRWADRKEQRRNMNKVYIQVDPNKSFTVP